MNKMICEMCGGNDLVKQEGVFICQSCGTKYSIEEAKKMMIDGSVDVTGSTVKVDNTAKLGNMYKVARRAKESGSVEQAHKYYDEILSIDSESWEATFYTVYFSAMREFKDADIGAAMLIIKNCLEGVYDLIECIEDPDEQEMAAAEVRSKAKDLCMKLRIAASDLCDDNERRARRALAGYGGSYVPVQNMLSWYQAIHSAQSIVNVTIETREGCLLEDIKKLRLDKNAAEAKRRFDEYWNAHQSEKVSLESERKSLAEQIRCLENELAAIPQRTDGYNHMLNLKQKLSNLYVEKDETHNNPDIVERQKRKSELASELNALGLFKRKEKKTINAQIDVIVCEIASIQAKLTNDLQSRIDVIINEIAPIESRINSTKDEVIKRITTLQSRVNYINTELTKPR